MMQDDPDATLKQVSDSQSSTETAFTQYVFFDVVGFTDSRSVEAQADIVAKMNAITLEALSSLRIQRREAILTSTGDGICIGLPAVENVRRLAPTHDLHLRVALKILELLAEYNASITDKQRQFEVRIGINQNVDNVVGDINGKRSLAGPGINVAQRVMDQGDARHLMAGVNVVNTLRHRQAYMDGAFREYSARDKNGQVFQVAQYIKPGHKGLDTDAPLRLTPSKASPREPLSKLAAYYVKNAIVNQARLALVRDLRERDAAVVMLYLMAQDNITDEERRPLSPGVFMLFKRGEASFDEQLAHYVRVDLWVMDSLANLLFRTVLNVVSSLFDERILAKKEALDVLRSDWPEVAAEVDKTLAIENNG